MKPSPLIVGLAGAALLASGIGTAVAAHPGAGPGHPDTPAKTTTKPAASSAKGSPAAASARTSRPVMVTYVFKGIIKEKGENATSLTLDLTGGNRHAKRLLTGGGVSIAGTGTHTFTLEVPAKTSVTKGTESGVTAFTALALGETVLVKYRAQFKATKGASVGAQVQAFTLATLDATPAKRVQVLGS
jgi:hypothetical protein